jgi:hypothetical protein
LRWLVFYAILWLHPSRNTGGSWNHFGLLWDCTAVAADSHNLRRRMESGFCSIFFKKIKAVSETCSSLKLMRSRFEIMPMKLHSSLATGELLQTRTRCYEEYLPTPPTWRNTIHGLIQVFIHHLKLPRFE